MCPNESEIVDHINMNPLDNRKVNLRVVDKSLNMINRPKQKTSLKKYTSKYKGVFKFRNKWKSSCAYKGKYHVIGYYDTELEAAKAYNKKIIELTGMEVCLNDTEGSQD